MKMIRIVMVIVTAASLLLAPVPASAASLGGIRVSLLEGDVQIKTSDAEDWGAAAVNGPLGEDDQIWVPPGGRVELQLNSGSYIRLDENSALQILSLDQNSSQFYLSQGHVYVYDNAPKGSVIQVDTPDTSIRAFVSSVFRIDISDQFTDVAVYKGYVEAENSVGWIRVQADKMLSLAQDSSGEVAPMGQPDAWEQWNKERNDAIFGKKGASSQYLPPELRTYAYDFDTGGRWVNVPDYGNCWTPTVAIGVGWAPYRLGRWAWLGGDYVWISDDPWGWAPYHYGRWSFIARIGWFWVPPRRGDVHWGPGYVGWVRTGDHVAWVPLAPREIYYGRGHFGRYSVNITNINVTRVNITRDYRNVRVNNGVMVVDRNSFATGSHRFVHLERNIIQRQLFARDNISIGAPAIKPSRESHFMSPRTIPSSHHPPQPVRNQEVRQSRDSRPFVRDPGKSVLNRDERPRPLPLNTVTTPRTPGRGERPQLKPQERRPAEPQGPAQRGEKPQIQPQERKTPDTGGPQPGVERPQVKPQERRTPDTGSPQPGAERPQVKPQEGRTPDTGGPQPGVERPQVKPQERRVITPEVAPPKEERPQAKPQERRVITPAVPPSRGEGPQVKPEERRPATPEGPPSRGKRPQVEPQERRPTEPQGPAKSSEKPQVRPQERKVAPPESAPSREERPQVKPKERRVITPEVAPPREERPQAKPQERRTPDTGGPQPGVERPQVKPKVKPKERRVITPEGAPSREERPQVKPQERRTPDTGGPQPEVEKPQVKPQERRPAAPEGRPRN